MHMMIYNIHSLLTTLSIRSTHIRREPQVLNNRSSWFCVVSCYVSQTTCHIHHYSTTSSPRHHQDPPISSSCVSCAGRPNVYLSLPRQHTRTRGSEGEGEQVRWSSKRKHSGKTMAKRSRVGLGRASKVPSLTGYHRVV